MKILQNQKGYTLLLTLIIILVIIIFFSTYTLSAINQQKQVEHTDDNYEVTAIAEMGVEYYRGNILNLIAEYLDTSKGKGKDVTLAKLTELNNYIKTANEEKEKSGKLPINYEENIKQIKDYPMKQLKKDIESLLMTPKDIPISISASFTIVKYISKTDGAWLIEVTGKKEKKEQTISATFKLPEKFDLFNFTTSEFDEKNTPSPLLTLPIFPNTTLDINTVKKCSDLYSKSNPKNICYTDTIEDNLRNLKNLELYYTKNSISNINQSLDSLSKLFVNNSLTINGSFNLKDSSELYIQKEAVFNNSFNGGINATIYSKGNLTLGSSNLANINLYTNKSFINSQHMTLDNVKLYANDISIGRFNHIKNGSIIEINNIVEFNKIDSISSSQLQINKSTIFNDIDSISGNSKISVMGNASIGHFNMRSGRIDIKGSLSLNDKNTSSISGGTIIVNSIKYEEEATDTKESISITDNGKLCIREISNISAIDKKKIKATGSGKIIFLNTNLEEWKIISGPNGTGSHTIEAGLSEFNRQCGTSSQSNPDKYDLNKGNLPSEKDITINISYK